MLFGYVFEDYRDVVQSEDDQADWRLQIRKNPMLLATQSPSARRTMS